MSQGTLKQTDHGSRMLENKTGVVWESRNKNALNQRKKDMRSHIENKKSRNLETGGWWQTQEFCQQDDHESNQDSRKQGFKKKKPKKQENRNQEK